MLTFSNDLTANFNHSNKSKSYGKAFLDFAKIKVSSLESNQDKEFCDRLCNASEEKAKAMIVSRTENNNNNNARTVITLTVETTVIASKHFNTFVGNYDKCNFYC
jgi:hypothetical protein